MSAVASYESWGAKAQKPTLGLAAGTTQPQIQLETIPCPGCGAKKFQERIQAADPLTKLGGKFSIVSCESCDFVMTNPRPKPASLGYFYPENYSPYDHSAGDGLKLFDRWVEQAALRTTLGYPTQPASLMDRFFARFADQRFPTKFSRHEWIPYTGQGRLLDVGCGAGGFLVRMQRLGWKVEGIDFAEDVARKVEQRTGIRVLTGTIPHANLKPASYDLVSLWHVLEHVPDPRATLQAAADLLAPGGKLVIEVPNIDSWSFEEFGSDWFALEAPRHLNHFSPKTLAATLPTGCFKVPDIQPIGVRSWIRKSAQLAIKNGQTKYESWLKEGKPLFTRLAAESEQQGRGDALRMIVERV